MLPEWTAPNNTSLGTINERQGYTINLPLLKTFDLNTKIIAGALPPGMRLESTAILGTPFEVAKTTVFKFVVRASTTSGVSDKTFTLTVEGADAPVWLTPEGTLPIGTNQTYFILDNSLIDFQLLATDNDLPAGDVLEYFIADNEGELPPGIQLTKDGRLVGLIEPLLSREFNEGNGYYDTTRFDESYYDYGADIGDAQIPKKINRNYEFIVTISDNETSVKRKFLIYVVGDDFVRADNNIMKAANGIFTADATYLRKPIWITASDLGTKRADNYTTLYLDVLDVTTLGGEIKYILEPLNLDGSYSKLPTGMTLDEDTGEIAGVIPYQPAVTEEYKFTVKATRAEDETGIISVTATFLEDTLKNTQVLKIAKLPIDAIDGVSDLERLRKASVVIKDKYYTIDNVDNTNVDYDLITLTQPISATPDAVELEVAKDAIVGQQHLFVKTLSLNDANYYLNKTFDFGGTNKFTVEDVYPYVEWRITSASPLTASDSSQNLQATLEAQLGYRNRFAYIDIESSTSIVVTIPATSKNRNQDFLKSLFANNDVVLKNLNNFDRLFLDTNLVNIYPQAFKFALGVAKGDVFVKKFVRSEREVVESTKTFTVKVRGEVDSTIAWVTPENLGSLKANRLCDLRVRAENILDQEVIKYTITSGSLPTGLELKSDGEIVGKVPVYATDTDLGLTFIDNGTTIFDGNTTTLDRTYEFVVDARDRFGFSAITRTFTLAIDDTDNLSYSNIYAQPLLPHSQRQLFFEYMGNSEVIPPELIYRPSDPNFGVQKSLRSLIFGGIETKEISEFVKATIINHKKKQFLIGDISTAAAKTPGTEDTVYEVVYLQLVDPAVPKTGKARKIIRTQSSKKMPSNSLAYEEQDITLPYNNPWRFRLGSQPITADNISIEAGQSTNSKLYLTNIDNMRDQIKTVGAESQDFIPLWMRTAQGTNLTQLGYVLSVPLVYTLPGASEQIKNNMIAAGYDFSFLNYTIDRYIVDSTVGNSQEQYIIFADYIYNI